ncbi:MAG: hypothetical protein Q7V15_02090 [Phenylobacterium sp.]|uniref:hypothetical protein n=1 Tax=Phenylobacterium sp. TaxID=1871053 RepID=UPI0027255929|nr:hypothetical protein [Phenylobacterium sp.]MDO8900124.1 hypothetical protein [Phenylobacterium sp.]
MDMSTPKEKEALATKRRQILIARKAAYKAPPESSRMIVALAQDRLKALQSGGIALDTRTTQVAAFQLAAAAFAAGLTGANAASLLAASLGAFACLAFVVGSGLAFWGMKSCDTQVAGLDASFWTGVVEAPWVTDRLVRSWAAETTEACTLEARRVDAERGRWLNRSLLAGAAGALAIVGATGANLYAGFSAEFGKEGASESTPRRTTTSQTAQTKVSPIASENVSPINAALPAQAIDNTDKMAQPEGVVPPR